jgi:dCMP deaminase
MEPERPSFPEIYMTLARALRARSTCSHARVGTVITSVDFRKVLAVGYSGNATGLPNRCDREVPTSTTGDLADCGCLHSEENAVIHCDAPRDEAKVVFVTQIPCRACAKRIIQLGGVVDLYYQSAEDEPPHSGKGEPLTAIDLLTSVGTRVHRLASPGL